MKLTKVLWLPREVLSSLVEEANRAAPKETGGVLLGYIAQDGGQPVVTHAVGPGPKAVHKQSRFVPDHEYQVAEIDRLYKGSNFQLQYLGDWHTHPGDAAYLSARDRATLKQIALCPEARIKQPIMLILAYGPEWEAAAWIAVPIGSLFRAGKYVNHPLHIELF